MENVAKVLERPVKSRMEVLQQHLYEPCVETCAGSWFACAKEVLKTIGINVYTYADSIRRCLRKGRQKQNNVMLVGPTNCRKSFLFNPLEMIFKTTVNPSLTSYAWVGSDEHEIAYLNDFRYSKECIKWSDFLLLLEGHTVKLPRPKNQFSTDLNIS